MKNSIVEAIKSQINYILVGDTQEGRETLEQKISYITNEIKDTYKNGDNETIEALTVVLNELDLEIQATLNEFDSLFSNYSNNTIMEAILMEKTRVFKVLANFITKAKK